MMISTRNLSKLPPPAALAQLGQSMAMFDAILLPEWVDRCYSFDAKWSRGERVFSMRDGSGDFFFVWLAKAGTVLQGFAHESAMSPWSRARTKERDRKPFPGMFDGLPKSLAYARTAASFCEHQAEVTFCVWSVAGGPWCIGDIAFPKGKDPDGSEAMLSVLDGKPATYAKTANQYADRRVRVSDVEKIFAHAPLTKALVQAINPDAELTDVKKEARSIGYPT